MRVTTSAHLVHVGGRKRPPAHALARVPALAKYLSLDVLPPPSVDYTPKAASSLSRIYANDRLGDCVIAGYAHCLGVWTGNADGGSPAIFTDDQVIAEYSAVGGYKPGDPTTDQGCDEYSALQHWQDQGGLDGSKLAGFVQVDACSQQECQIALTLFGALYFGVELPDAWLSAPAVWDVAGDPNPNSGHCVVGAGYDTDGVTICTWGRLVKLTWAALAKYGAQDAGGMVWALLSPDWLARGQLAPNGVDWDCLRADLDALSLPAPPLP